MKTYINIINVFVLCVFVVPNIYARDYTDEEYASLPRLFHLDDYHSCLSQKEGLYCLAKFQLTPTKIPHVLYDLIKILHCDRMIRQQEYSEDVRHYNRRVIHRGYCVSARWPDSRTNNTLRLQRCANQRVRPHHLRATLHTLYYCRSHNDTIVEKPPDTPQNVFLYIVYVIIFLNIFATLYDFMWKDKKNALLTAWSIPSNWQRLTTSYESKDPRLSSLAVLQGCRLISQATLLRYFFYYFFILPIGLLSAVAYIPYRVVVMLLFLYVHAVELQNMLYMQNPQYMENVFARISGMIIIKGTSIVQMFVMMSSFLCAYNMLLSSGMAPLSLTSFPKNVLKRIIRISPVNLLMVGYGATWWPRARDGPLTELIIGPQSQTCRQKFWYHAFFVNNLFDTTEPCFIQTWFLTVDMQLYILATFLTLSLAPLKRRAVPLLAALFVSSCVVISAISYIQHWKSLLYIANPKSLRALCYNEPSFQGLYTSPLGNLPACLMGLFVAHVHYYLNESGYKLSENKLLSFTHHLIIPIYMAWLISGMYIKNIRSHAFTAAYAGMERFIFCVLCAIQLIGFINIESTLRKFFAWRGWDTFAKMSLSIMMVHWCVNTILVVPRPYANFASAIDISADAAATIMITYIIAIPVAVLVELPMQKFLDIFLQENARSTPKK